MAELATWFRMGWRNLWLHPLRTALTSLGLATGIAGLTFLSAMNDGWLQQIRTNFALTVLGHIQIHAEGFEQSRRLRDAVPDPEPLLQKLAGIRDIAVVTRRVRVSGLATSAHGNAGVIAMGVEPEAERATSRLAQFVREGRWLRETEQRDAVIGAGLAERLGVGLGDKIVLMAAAPDGEIASEVFRVRGLMHSGVMDIDEMTALVPLADAQRWLGLGRSVTDIVIRARDFDRIASLADRIRAALPDDPPLEVLRWSEIDPMAQQWADFADAYTWVVLLIVILIVLAEVLNTMLMNMRERIREFGLMAALGMSSGGLFAMVVSETLVLVAIGAAAGLAIGAGLALWFAGNGIDLSRFTEAFSFMYMDPVVHPELRPASVSRILLATLAGALLASLAPAWRAASLEPAKALRSIE
ncbi:MAG: ABC transporter permease [Mariprofundaceae bacterium]